MVAQRRINFRFVDVGQHKNASECGEFRAGHGAAFL